MKKNFFLKYSVITIISATMIILTIILFIKVSSTLNAPQNFDFGAVAEHSRNALNNSLTIPDETVMLLISPDGNEENVRKTLELVKSTSDEICRGIDSEYDKLYAISQWVSRNFYYDYDASESSVTQENIAISSVLETRRTVCLGFANLYAALCQAQGIDCRVVHGVAAAVGTFDATNGEGEIHEWNVAIIDGKTIWVDSLWNTSNSYRDGVYEDGNIIEKYFDISDEMLARNHRADRVDIRNYFSVPD